MKPTPNQLIDGVRELLRSSIGPELSSEQARSHLRRVMAVLREFDWNEAVPALHRENAALSMLLAEAARWLARHGDPHGEDERHADADALTLTAGHGFDTVQAHNAALRSALARRIAQCEALALARPATDFARCRMRLAAGLAQLAADAPVRRAARTSFPPARD